MFESIKKILGMGPEVDYQALVRQGAIILDVRTKAEYDGGHLKGSINIAVDQLGRNLNRLPDKEKPIITCCASGMRSSAAKRMLKASGYTQVYNGGSWTGLRENLR